MFVFPHGQGKGRYRALGRERGASPSTGRGPILSHTDGGGGRPGGVSLCWFFGCPWARGAFSSLLQPVKWAGREEKRTVTCRGRKEPERKREFLLQQPGKGRALVYLLCDTTTDGSGPSLPEPMQHTPGCLVYDFIPVLPARGRLGTLRSALPPHCPAAVKG